MKHSLFLLLTTLTLFCIAGCTSGKSLADRFAGNTLVGKDYATYFPDRKIAIMHWQGKTSQKTWWVENGQFCHSTDDGSVCEQVKQLSENRYEFCGRWGCFPATLEKGNTQHLMIK